MQVTIDIPDWLAEEYAKAGKEPAQGILEAVAVDGYRTGKFGDGGAAQILSYETRMLVHDLLKEYDVYLNYSLEDLREDLAFAKQRSEATRSKSAAA